MFHSSRVLGGFCHGRCDVVWGGESLIRARTCPETNIICCIENLSKISPWFLGLTLLVDGFSMQFFCFVCEDQAFIAPTNLTAVVAEASRRIWLSWSIHTALLVWWSFGHHGGRARCCDVVHTLNGLPASIRYGPVDHKVGRYRTRPCT